jgi:non-canonical poly(A) RNA polymerase PAPD5/7
MVVGSMTAQSGAVRCGGLTREGGEECSTGHVMPCFLQLQSNCQSSTSLSRHHHVARQELFHLRAQLLPSSSHLSERWTGIVEAPWHPLSAPAALLRAHSPTFTQLYHNRSDTIMGDHYQPSRRQDTWRPDDSRRTYRDDYDDRPRRASPPPRTYNNDSGFTFRGAANDNYNSAAPRRAEESFTFQAGGPPAPRFQPSNAPPNKNRDRRNEGGRGRGRGRGGAFRGRGRGFMSRPAHARDLLKSNDRATTPELMEGMNEGAKSQYIEYITSSDEDSDAASTGGDLADDAPRHKRAKTEADTAAAESVPKWSNPDPYTVLPPTDFSVAPKKDIVQTIRKAKVEATSQKTSTNAIKENADFISFNDFEKESEEEPEDEHQEMQQDPSQDTPLQVQQEPQQFHRAHDDSHEEGEIDEDVETNKPVGVDLGFAITPKFGNQHSSSSSNFPPPAPPTDVDMALQDSDLAETYVPPLSNAGGKRKRRDEPRKSSANAGYVVEEWQEDGSNPTPWHKDDGTFKAYVGLQ